MPSPVAPRLHHIAITVTDLDASVEWYEQIFAIRRHDDEPHEGGLGRLLADDSMSLVIVLHRHDTNDGSLFAETVTGLDHVGLVVPGRGDLVSWQQHLEAHGVERADRADRPLTQSPITDRPYGSVLVFRDPDNIQLELYALPSA
jgi:catechol 2,3-dioxygenase-like lactoylglutathione lyase family enzyme